MPRAIARSQTGANAVGVAGFVGQVMCGFRHHTPRLRIVGRWLITHRTCQIVSAGQVVATTRGPGLFPKAVSISTFVSCSEGGTRTRDTTIMSRVLDPQPQDSNPVPENPEITGPDNQTDPPPITAS